MYVVKVPNRGSPPAVLLRESYRQDGKVKNRTLANLSAWPESKVGALARVLKGQPPAVALDGAFEITRSLPHGHVAAVLGTARQLGLEELIDPEPSRHRDLVTAMAAAQVIAPDSKLAIARGLRGQAAASSPGDVLGAGGCDEDDLYAAMDYLATRQDKIQDALAARHLVRTAPQPDVTMRWHCWFRGHLRTGVISAISGEVAVFEMGEAQLAAVRGQQSAHHQHKFPGDIERGTIADHVEPSR